MPRFFMLAPHRRSMVSSGPITIGLLLGTKDATSRLNRRQESHRADHLLRFSTRWQFVKCGTWSNPVTRMQQNRFRPSQLTFGVA
jgi:hypothetical protein